MYEKSLVAANDGNISWRISEGEILVSPSGVCKADMTPDMILRIDMDGNILEGHLKPSSELKMHLKVYHANPERKAVVHAHPAFAGAFSLANLPLDRIVYPTAYAALGPVPLARYGAASTDELADSIEGLIREGRKAILLANHGALTCAGNLWDAYFLMESLESYAKISLLAKLLGGARELDDDEKERLETKIASRLSEGAFF
jgi:L-fuculose-phosphate aldolase